MALEFVPYRSSDRAACAEIFKSNIPEFFLESELELFFDYLDKHAHENYWVMLLDGKLIGCGGYWLQDAETARLVWGLVHSSLHKKGYGRKQVEFRLNKLLAIPTIKKIQLDTSQHNPGFFNKFGFGEFKVTPNKYGPHLHSHEMELIIERKKS